MAYWDQTTSLWTEIAKGLATKTDENIPATLRAPAIQPNIQSALWSVSNAPIESPSPSTQTQSMNNQQAAGISTTMHLFSDEQSALQNMLKDGLSQDEATSLIQQRRRDLAQKMGVDLKLADDEKTGLVNMVNDGLDTKTALNLLKQKRAGDYEKLPEYKKVGQAAVGLWVGALTTAGKTVNNLLDFAIQPTGYKGFWEEAQKYTEAQKQAESLPGESTASQIGSGIMGAGLTVAAPAPSVGGAWLGWALTRWVVYGGGYGAINPIVEKGSRTTTWDIATGAWLGAAGWAILWPVAEKVVAPVLAATAEKVGKYGTAAIQSGINQGLWEVLPAVGRSISRDVSWVGEGIQNVFTRTLPEKVVENNLKLTPTERGKVENITGLTPAQNALKWNIAAEDKAAQAETLDKAAQANFGNIGKRLATSDEQFTSNDAKDALSIMKDELESSPIMKTRFKNDIGTIDQLIQNPTYTGEALNGIRRSFDRLMGYKTFTSGGQVKSWEAAALADIREGLSNDVQKAGEKIWIDIKWMNNDLRAQLIMKDGILRSLSQEQKNNIIGLQDLGIAGILGHWNPLEAIAVIAAKKFWENAAPKVAQKVFNLNKSPYAKNPVKRGNTISTGRKPGSSSILDRALNPNNLSPLKTNLTKKNK